MKHIVDYCSLCETKMVRCGTCNNPCCNGTYGGEPGNWCLDCPSAYEEGEKLWDMERWKNSFHDIRFDLFGKMIFTR